MTKFLGLQNPLSGQQQNSTCKNLLILALCVGSQQLEMLGPSGLPETMDID